MSNTLNLKIYQQILYSLNGKGNNNKEKTSSVSEKRETSSGIRLYIPEGEKNLKKKKEGKNVDNVKINCYTKIK